MMRERKEILKGAGEAVSPVSAGPVCGSAACAAVSPTFAGMRPAAEVPAIFVTMRRLARQERNR
jgi:hypothetical protein